MPPIVIAVVAAAAAYGGAAAAVYVGLAASMTAFGAVVAGALAGSVVAMGAGMAMQAIAGKPRAPSLEQGSTEQKQTIRAQISPRRVIYGEQKVSGPLLYAASSGANQGTLHMVVALAGHPVDAITTIWINDDPIQVADLVGGTVVTGKYAQRAGFGVYRGDQTAADGGLLAESPDGWTADHKLLGIAYLHCRLVYDPKLYQGMPNISALVRGKNDILDPRTNTRGYSTNWALCILDYLLGDHGLACDADELNLGSFISAANLSDEQVPLNAGGSVAQARYTLSGSFTLDAAPITVVEGMLAAGAGALVYVAGEYRLHGGAYVNPTASIGESDFAGPVELQTMPPRAELFNSIRGTFVDPSRFWQASQFPALQDATALAADGEEIWHDVELAWITDPTRAQRIARQMLHRMRAPLTVRAPLRYSAIQFSVWQTVSVTLADFGWVAKPFRVTSFSFDPSGAGCTVTLTEEQVAAYAWLYDQAIAVPDHPDTTLVDPLTIPAPTNLVAVSSTAVQPDGSIAPAIDVSWTASNHAFVTAHEVQWRVPNGVWLSRDVAMPVTRFVIEPVVSGVLYEIQVRGVTGLARGPWVGASQTAAADTTAPALPTGLAAAGVLRGIALSWTLPTDRDLAAIEIFENATSSTTGRTKIGETRASVYLRTGLAPSDTRWFWLRARDTTGNLSGYTAAVQGTASALVVTDIGQGIIETAAFASSIKPVEVILNTAIFKPDGTVAVSQADGKLYTRVAGQWIATVQPLGPGGTLTSDQIQSLAAAKLAGQIAETQITDLAISTPKLATGAVVAAKIGAGAVTTEKLSVGGGNVIANSTLTRSTAGWAHSQYGGSPVATLGAALPAGLQIWVPRAIGGGYLRVPNATLNPGQGAYADWRPDAGQPGIPVVPGEKIQARALLGSLRCGGRLEVIFLDGNFAQVGALVSTLTTTPSGGTEDWAFAPHALIGTVPATAVLALLRVVLVGNNQNDPYLFFSKTLLSRAPANATEVADWTPGGVTEIFGGMIRANTVEAEQINTDQLFADAGTFNSMKAGIASFGGLTATEIAAGQLKAVHMASETLITQTAQVGNLIIGTEKITAEAISTLVMDTVSHGGGGGSNVYVWAAGFSLTVPQTRTGSLLVTWTQGYTATPRATGIQVYVDGVLTRAFESNATTNYNTITAGLNLAAGGHSVEIRWRGEPGTLLYDVHSIVLVRAK